MHILITLSYMLLRNSLRQGEYHDSNMLMRITDEIRKVNGVVQAAVFMGTDSNKKLLKNLGLLTKDVDVAGSNDLTISILAGNEKIIEEAFSLADKLLKESPFKGVAEETYMTLASAMKAMPDANLAIISIPGEYAAREAKKALENDLNVLLFSSNVSLEDEIMLKKLAFKKGLLVMGPDCGTAIINNIAIAFANVVKPGQIGIVGAAGTGIQQVSCIIDREGFGISHAFGTGGRDLSREVGGISMLQGIEILDNDNSTEVIILISKPPSSEVMKKVLKRAESCTKPVIVNFLGKDTDMILKSGLIPASTLEEAATKAVNLIRTKPHFNKYARSNDEKIRFMVEKEIRKLKPYQTFIRGLFSGGTLCYEAELILQEMIDKIYSNVALKSNLVLEDPWTSYQNTLLDIGSEEFVMGRSHPMIDPTIRNNRLLQEAKDPKVAVLLLDVVLGYGAHHDPAGALEEPISKAKAISRNGGRYLALVTSVCGTKNDPQNLLQQERKLRKMGFVVMPTNAQAARMAGLIACHRS